MSVPNLMPCVICGKPAKTIRDDDGKVLIAGIHEECAKKHIKVVEEDRMEDN